MTAGILLAVDGNSVVTRNYYARIGTAERHDGRPTWAVSGFLDQLLAAVARVQPHALLVGFDDPARNARRDGPAGYGAYKAGRKPKPPELPQQMADTAAVLAAAGLAVATPPGLEADDVLASAAAAAGAAGWHTVILTSDMDAVPLVTPTITVIRLTDAGVAASPALDPAAVKQLTGMTPTEYGQYRTFRGDASDNLPGVPGVGEKTAAALIHEFGTADRVWADVAAGGRQVAAACGTVALRRLAADGARRAYRDTARLMTMHADVDTGLDLADPHGHGRLPVNPDRLGAALGGLGLPYRTATRMLCTGWTARPPHHPTVTEPRRGRAAAPEPAPPAEPAPTDSTEPDAITLAAAFPPPVPHPAVTNGDVDPYHCMRCGNSVTPHRASIEQARLVVCQRCTAREDAYKAEHGRHPDVVAWRTGRNPLWDRPETTGMTPPPS